MKENEKSEFISQVKKAAAELVANMTEGDGRSILIIAADKQENGTQILIDSCGHEEGIVRGLINYATSDGSSETFKKAQRILMIKKLEALFSGIEDDEEPSEKEESKVEPVTEK